MDDREFMEWFIDSLISLDIYWNEDRDELIDGAIDKPEVGRKLFLQRIECGLFVASESKVQNNFIIFGLEYAEIK